MLRFVFGACFYYFFLSTLKSVDDESIGWTLVAMEAASLVCLYRGAVSIFRRRCVRHSLACSRACFPACLPACLPAKPLPQASIYTYDWHRRRSLALLGTTADELLFDFDVLMERRLVDYADKRLIFTWENKVRAWVVDNDNKSSRCDSTVHFHFRPSKHRPLPNQVEYHPNALVADLEHLARTYERLAHVIQGVRGKRDGDAVYVLL